MSKQLLFTVLLLLLLFSLEGCVSKRLTQKGLTLEQSGLMVEAADFYLQALQYNSNNLEARSGLSRAGQIVLNQHLSQFKKEYDANHTKEAIYAYRTSKEYYNRVNQLGVKLFFPEEYGEYYNEVEDKYLNEKYISGMQALDADNFTQAQEIFSEIVKLNNSYKDAKAQLTIAIYEPKYRDATQTLENQLPRTAYYKFSDIEQKTGGYKDSKALKQTALERATIYISIGSFEIKNSSWYESQRGYIDFRGELLPYIEKSITNSKSPFYKLLKSNTPYPSKDGVIDTTPQKQKAILSGKIVSFETLSSHKENPDKRAYRAGTVEVMDTIQKKMVPKRVYNKIKYTEKTDENRVNASISYTLINASTNQILLTNGIDKTATSSVSINYFNGEIEQLYPGYWESSTKPSTYDEVKTNPGEVKIFRDSFKSKESPKTQFQLRNEVAQEIANQIADQIAKYNPEQQ